MVLDGVPGKQMRDYFNDGDRATWERENYIFWWSEHTVVIHQGLVCEYSNSAGTYRETPVQDYLRPFKTSLLYLARL